MLRTGAVRTLKRSLLNARPSNTQASASNVSWKAKACSNARCVSSQSSFTLALTPHKPASTALLRYGFHTSGSRHDEVDLKHEKELRNKELRPHPERVSESSTMHPVFSEVGVPEEEKDVDMMAGIRSDLRTIKETFSLEEVPKEALYIGMAGVLPYVATSLSTVYLAWDLNHAATHGTGVLLSAESAQLLLQIMEPLQIGYGAVIISFLGAIHWGLEWAGFGGYHGYSRYKIGVIAPAVAWPTTLMSVEYALIAQFLAFNWLYFTDARAASKGRAPYWYGVYRFVLTFVVGAAIVVSLIGRGQIAEYTAHATRPSNKLQALKESQMMYLESEERERQARAEAAAMEEDEGEEEEEEGGDEE